MRNRGFSLVEVAVVLIIIGVIVGGVMSGSNLIRQSRYKAVLTEMNDMATAIIDFQARYQYRPGDLPNAANFFAAPANVNGNGNDRWDAGNEKDVAWLQLSQAGMIQQRIINGAGTGVINRDGVNGDRPNSKLDNAGWTVLSNFTIPGLPGGLPNLTFDNLLRIGGADGNEDLRAPVLEIAGHQFMENKIDSPNTPISGRYIIGEGACVRNNGGEALYLDNADQLCTGNLVLD